MTIKTDAENLLDTALDLIRQVLVKQETNVLAEFQTILAAKKHELTLIYKERDDLAKRCARQAVELEVARKDSKLFHQLLQLHHSDAMELFAVLQIASGAIGHIHDCVTGKSSAENDELAYIINAAENKAKECLKKHYQAYSAEARSNPAGSFNTTLAAGKEKA